ncbi:expressed unknown protein [Seminavis robusta]|uniref:Uncharacterized protein n=1 Tax=Seminavis robusta TaxID=568900 RepID=A0A9N8EJW0_9STRA|nr:expressed unknown protein [Seminavis robusta]|eukprot:Sro1303_g260950.1 n/a (128) ;mRNA; r:3686-4069
MTTDTPETPRRGGITKEEPLASSTADGADLGLKQSVSEESVEPRIWGKVGAVEDSILPKAIKDKAYQSSEEFFKDLKKHGLQDCKYGTSRWTLTESLLEDDCQSISQGGSQRNRKGCRQSQSCGIYR